METNDNSFFQKFIKFVCRILYWLIPVCILAVIFKTIEFDRLFQILKQVDIKLMSTGVAIFPCVVFLGAFRWRILLEISMENSNGLRFALKHYWIGLAIGKFFPAAITWDIYRIIIAGKILKNYAIQTMVILVEKISALICALFLLAMVYPFVKKDIVLNEWIMQIKNMIPDTTSVNIPVALFIIFTGLFFTVIFILFLLRFLKQIEIKNEKKFLTRLFTIDLISKLIFLSILIHIATAFSNYLFFSSLEIHIPVKIHFFLIPILTILVLMPVTFAGLGIREGSFIILYGMFEIPMETALLVSFMNLFANLVNSAIGGALAFFLKAGNFNNDLKSQQRD